MKKHGYWEGHAIAIDVLSSGEPRIYEGNHRVRAAVSAGLNFIPAEVRYLGSSEKLPNSWKPV